MDTWATSSLTPQIATGWVDDPDLFARTFPMDLRPQGPEIIRTWLFDTVVRSWFEHKRLPWSDTTINGWVLDPDRKKMSKSIGNVVTPMPLVEEYGADALRYWACNGRPGVDTAVDYGIMKIGRKLAIKILNASKFTLNIAGDTERRAPAAITEPLDRSMLAALAATVDEATTAFDAFDYARGARARRTVLLVVLRRLRRAREGSGVRRRGRRRRPLGRGALRTALSTLLRLFAPFLPFVTEEVWSWWQEGSVHLVAVARSRGDDPDRRAPTRSCSTVAGEVLGAVRKEKSEQKVSLATPVERVVVVRHRRAARRAARRARRRPGERGRDRRATRASRPGPSSRSRSSSPPRRERDANVPDGAQFRGAGAWLDGHVNLETGVGAPPARQRGAPTLERIATLLQYLGSPEDGVPGDPPDRHQRQDEHACGWSTQLLADARAAGRRLHEPAPRTGERARRRSTVSRSTTKRSTSCCTRCRSSSAGRRRSVVLRGHDRRPRSGGSPTRRSTSRWSRSAWAARGTRRTSSTPTSRSSRTSASTTSSTSARRREEIAAEKAGIVKPGATLVLGETDEVLQEIFAAATRSAHRAARRRLRRAEQRGRRGRALHRPLHADRGVPRRVPRAPRRAPGRQRRDRARRRRGVRRGAAPARGRRRGVRERRVAGPPRGRATRIRSSCSTARTTSPARRRCGGHSTRSSAPSSARTLVVGFLREKDPVEMLAALGVDAIGGLVVCCRAPSPRALDPEVVAKAAIDLGVPPDAWRSPTGSPRR